MALKSIAKARNQKVARQPKCFSFFFFFFFFFFRRASSNLRDSFTMGYAQNSSIFHWVVHQPIAFFQVWSHTRRFEPFTAELWLPLGTPFIFTCTHAHKSLSNETSLLRKIAELEILLVCGECLKKPGFFSQYGIGSLWGEICCSLQLKHASDVKKGTCTTVKNLKM